MRLQKILGTRLSFAAGLLAATALALLTTAVSGHKVFAASPQYTQDVQNMTLTFVDRATIKGTIGQDTYLFVDGDIGDGHADYQLQGSTCGGNEHIDFGFNGLQGPPYVGDLSMKVNPTPGAANSKCTATDPSTIRKNVDGAGANTWFVQTSETTIARADGRGDEIYEQDPSSPNKNAYLNTSQGSCKDIIVREANGIQFFRMSGDGRKPEDVFGAGPAADYFNKVDPGCKVSFDARYGNGQVMPLGAQPNNPNAEGSTGANGQQQEEPTCENRSIFSLNWLICPLIDLIQRGIDLITDNIQSLLEFDANYYNNPALKDAWSNVNRLATYGLVAAGLIMVIATALGFALVDAYTLRKVLPRLIIAAVGMQLSWYIMIFFIQAINDIGKGLADLMYAPFHGEAHVDLLAALKQAGFVGGGIHNGIFVAATVLGIGIAGLAIILSFATSALGVIFVAFMILLLRRLVILTLIVLAPVAIVSAILPNTDGLWKFWRKAFVDLLIMYPLIMMLIAGGKIFAYIATGAPNAQDAGFAANMLNNVVNLGAITVGHFGVLAGIPWLAARIGGMVANITGIVNDRSKGFFDKRRNQRAETWKGRKEAASENRLYNNFGNFKLRPGGKTHNLGAGINTIASWGASPIGNTRYKLGERARGESGQPDTRFQRLMARAGGSVYSDIDTKIGTATDKLAQYFLSRGVVIDKAHLALAGQLQGEEEAAFKKAMIDNGIMNESEYASYKKTGVKDDSTLAKVRQGLNAVDDARYVDRFRDASSQLGNIQGQLGELHKNPDLAKGNVKMASAYVAATQGFLDNDQITDVANSMIDSGYSRSVAAAWAGKTSAAAFSKGVLEAKATYGTKIDENGRFYNAMSGDRFDAANKTVNEDRFSQLRQYEAIMSDPRYSNAAKDSEEGKIFEATKESLRNARGVAANKDYFDARALISNQLQLVSGLKGNDWATIKGDKRVKNMRPVMEYVLQGNAGNEQASQMRNNIEYMIDYGNADVGSRAAMQELLNNTPPPPNYQSKRRQGGVVASGGQLGEMMAPPPENHGPEEGPTS